MIVALALLLIAAGDPRPSLISLQLEGRDREALAAVEEVLRQDPERGREIGLDYLRGHLLEVLGRTREAHHAFAQVMGTSPSLAGYGRYRLAVNQHRMGHPEVAAGLLATLLGRQPPASLVPAASRLLVNALRAGGDCRLLRNVEAWRLPEPETRSLLLAKADCTLRSGNREEATELLRRLLEQAVNDEPARGAAELLALAQQPASWPPTVTLLLGRTFHHHRQFHLAIQFLEQGLGPAAGSAGQAQDEFDDGYALARSYFWHSQFEQAALRFGALATARPGTEAAARVLYQQGRTFELHGDWRSAVQSFQESFAADPTGEWAPAALLSNLRLEWRTGHEAAALEHYDRLLSRRQWRDLAGRAALFLAASELVRGRADRANGWLLRASRGPQAPIAEIAYWRGRLAELRLDPAGAVDHYLTALLEDPFHPLSQAARHRLAKQPLAEIARQTGARLASSERTSELIGAWYLLGETDVRGLEARRHVERHLAKNPDSASFLEMAQIPPAEWPLWQSKIRQPEELLLALGLLEQGPTAVQRHFPVAEASLGYTGSFLLARGGLTKASLYQAEVLADRLPRAFPQRLLPLGFRRLLYPLPFRSMILQEADRFAIDPHLLAALIREESRFDPLAVSSASARGLTQFILPTAHRLAARLGLERLKAEDLYRPEIAIALGAAYLAELTASFNHQSHLMIAAYNAGEQQAQLWQTYCYSREPEEYYTKIGFNQTRSYLRKVLSSRAQYLELYGASQPGD